MKKSSSYFRVLLCLALILPVSLHAVIISPQLCAYVLNLVGITAYTQDVPSEQETFEYLSEFFAQRNIKDYTDAASYGRSNNVFMNPDALSNVLWNVFVTHTIDICPSEPKLYQAIFFNTSGIDVFMERLAFLARLVKSGKVTAHKLIALVGHHTHREDLKDPIYLAQLPFLFDQEFDLHAYDKKRVLDSLADLLEKDTWLHKDGMAAAWRLIRCDETMVNLEKIFSYFPQDSSENLRTEQLLQRIGEVIDQPLDHDHAIALICNAQGAAKTIEMIDKLFPDQREYIDILIAKSVPSDKEGKLFNDTPQQRAMTKLFHLYRILEARLHH